MAGEGWGLINRILELEYKQRLEKEFDIVNTRRVVFLKTILFGNHYEATLKH